MKVSKRTLACREILLRVLREYRGGFLTTYEVQELTDTALARDFRGFDVLPHLHALHAAGQVERIENRKKSVTGKFYTWRFAS